MDFWSLLGITSTISGVNARELFQMVKSKKDKKLSNIFGISIARLLSIFDDENDKLTGYWKVAKWDYLIKENGSYKNSGYHVWGSLSVLYKYPNEEKWKGILTLTYYKKRNKKAILPWLAKFIEKKLGNFFHGIYEVELLRKQDNLYFGTTSMIFREPEIYKYYDGEFTNLSFDQYGRLVGKHRNTGPFPEAKNSIGIVMFHQRKRWREIDKISW